MKGALGLVKVILGTSLVTVVLGILSLIVAIMR
jgi:hypothetical protein